MSARYWHCRECGARLVRDADGIRYRHPRPPEDGHAPRPTTQRPEPVR